MSGSIVKESANQQPNTTIDVSALPAGTYIVAVLQGTTRYTKQFIKQ
jgi:DNA gyrase inhibitor GyrI